MIPPMLAEEKTTASRKLSVALAPLPPKTIFALGTRVELEELPETTRLPDGVTRGLPPGEPEIPLVRDA